MITKEASALKLVNIKKFAAKQPTVAEKEVSNVRHAGLHKNKGVAQLTSPVELQPLVISYLAPLMAYEKCNTGCTITGP